MSHVPPPANLKKKIMLLANLGGSIISDEVEASIFEGVIKSHEFNGLGDLFQAMEQEQPDFVVIDGTLDYTKQVHQEVRTRIILKELKTEFFVVTKDVFIQGVRYVPIGSKNELLEFLGNLQNGILPE